MKRRYLYLMMLACMLVIGSATSCSDNDNNSSAAIDNNKTELLFDTDTLKIEVGQSASVSIRQGGGDYRAIVENTDIISEEISGNTLNVTSKKRGITGIVVSDAKGNYKRLVVKSMYLTMETDKEEVTINMKVGHSDGTSDVNVLVGNGQYTTVSDDPSIAEATFIQDAKITISGKKQGTAHITIKDMMGLSKTVTVQVNTTEIPFTDEEKAEIMKDNTQRYMWDGYLRNASGYATMVKTIEDGQNKIGWTYYNDYNFNYLTFPGELTEGTTAVGRVRFKTSFGYNAEVKTIDNVKVEIIKNDGNTVWGIMSVIYEGYLYCGYFVEPLQ